MTTMVIDRWAGTLPGLLRYNGAVLYASDISLKGLASLENRMLAWAAEQILDMPAVSDEGDVLPTQEVSHSREDLVAV
ncbi:MAG: hypothetical protein Q7U75_04080, partial [Desulfobacterales bacterium]|nr:hypothetical protein [Desulfobacterales bacterium]